MGRMFMYKINTQKSYSPKASEHISLSFSMSKRSSLKIKRPRN